jgi:hypothetical protein
MPNVITRSTYLEINSVPLATPAWRILDLSRLHGLAVRGSDRIMPGANGMRAQRRRRTIYSQSLPLLVVGRYDREGNVLSNVYDGLDDNIDYLMTNVIEPPSTATVAAVWHRAGGNKSAAIHVEGFDPDGWGNGWIRFSLAISIPSGTWT